MADPASGNPPIDGAGSDTTQDVLNGLAAVIEDANGNPVIGSYNATGSATITPQTSKTLPRPNGSGQGKTALIAAVGGTTLTLNGITSSAALNRGDIEFARSSSGAAFTANGQFNYLPFGVDAVTFATGPTTDVPSDMPLGSTIGQDADSDGNDDLTLRNIYGNGASTTLEDASGVLYTVGAAGSGADIVPFQPQAGSGTRAFFQTTIGGPYRSVVADNYTVGGTSQSVQEHDGSVTADVANAIVPFSVAQYIAQGRAGTLSGQYNVTVADRREGAQLGALDGVDPINLAGNLETNLPVSRPVFNIVERNAITVGQAAYNSTLDGLFDGSGAEIFSATRPGTSISVINDFGFGTIPSTGITIGGVNYLPGDERYRAN